jgi:hypothetical protein
MTPALVRSPYLTGAVSLFLLLTAAYIFSVDLRATRGASITGDEPFYLLTTQSLLQDGNLDLRGQYATESYRSFFDHPYGLWEQSVPNDGGVLLSPHEPGLSLLLLPGFALAGLRGAQVELMLLTSVTFTLAYVLAAAETRLHLLSWAVTAAVGLSATAFVYATEVYPEFAAALCLVLSLLILRFRSRDWSSAIFLAAALSALAWLGMKFVPVGAVLGIAFLAGATMRGRVIFVALTAVSGLAYVWFHLAFFGDLTAYSLNTVHEGASAASVLQSHIRLEDRIYRLWGLFLDRRFGLGHWTPLFLLVLPSLPLLLARGQTGRLAAGLILVQMLLAAFVAITMMGWWFPGRTLVAVLPLFALALTVLMSRLARPLQIAAGVLAMHSLAITGALVAAARSGEVTLAVDPWAMDSIFFRAFSRLFPDYRTWTNETVLLTAFWLALGFALTSYLIWTRHGQSGRRFRPSAGHATVQAASR